MEQHINKEPRSLYSKEQKLDFLARYKTSHISISEFCNRHNISESSFRKWQSRYRHEAKQVQVPGFAQLQVTAEPVNTSEQLFAEVKGVKIYQPVSASYIKELLG